MVRRRAEVKVDEMKRYAAVTVSRDERAGGHADMYVHAEPDEFPHLPLGPTTTHGCFDQMKDPHGPHCLRNPSIGHSPNAQIEGGSPNTEYIIPTRTWLEHDTEFYDLNIINFLTLPINGSLPFEAGVERTTYPSRSEEIAKTRCVALSALPRETRAPSADFYLHSCQSIAIRNHFDNLSAKFRSAAWRKQVIGLEKFWNSADVRGNARKSSGHGFDKSTGQTLSARRKDEQVGFIETRHDGIGTRKPPRKSHAVSDA